VLAQVLLLFAFIDNLNYTLIQLSFDLLRHKTGAYYEQQVRTALLRI